MALKNSSTAREIIQLRKDIEALKESMKPPIRWIEVIVELGEDVPEIDVKGFHVVENHLWEPEPASEQLPPEYVAVADASAAERERSPASTNAGASSQRGTRCSTPSPNASRK